ncbi:hypothetical protein LCGC14_2604640, partial [marine sediment metagenome]
VEWKCGMEGYARRGDAPMCGPLADLFSNCPLNQAFVQALFCEMMTERNYGITAARSYVVQIDADGIAAHPLPRAMRAARRACYEHACASAAQRRARQARRRQQQQRTESCWNKNNYI